MATKKKIEEPVVDEVVVEVIEDVEEVVPEPEVARTDVIAEPGDSYPALAERYAPDGVKVRDYARILFELNRGKTVRPGIRIKLK